MADMILGRDFYFQAVQVVARQLIGKVLVCTKDAQRVGGIIVETEAYDGESDQACHARRGKTERNQVMYGVGGRAYVYFTYGMHWLLNCVCGNEGYPAAVLIRAIVPTEGIAHIQARRSHVPPAHWCDGPAKLTRALGIDGSFNGLDLCHPSSGLYIEDGISIHDEDIQTTPRIGISYAPEPWHSMPWRFTIPTPADLCTRLTGNKDIIRSGR